MRRWTLLVLFAAVTTLAGPGAPSQDERERERPQQAAPVVAQPRVAVPERVVVQPSTTFQNPVAPPPTSPGTFSRPASTFQTPAGSFSRPASTFHNPAAPYVPVPRPISQHEGAGFADGRHRDGMKLYHPRYSYGYPSVVVVPVEVPVPVFVETVPIQSDTTVVTDQAAPTQTEETPVVVDLPPGARILKPAAVAAKAPQK